MGEWTKEKKLRWYSCVGLFFFLCILATFTPIYEYGSAGWKKALTEGGGRPKVLFPEGCKKEWDCPWGHQCLTFDFDFVNFRQCQWWPAFGWRMQVPPPMDENETYAYDVNKWEAIWEHMIGMQIWRILIIISGGRCAQYLWQTLYRVIKNNDKFVWNSTAAVLLIACIYITPLAVWNFGYFFGSFGFDPNSWHRDWGFAVILLPVEANTTFFLAMTIPLAWADLVFKTMSMSKNSTKGFQVVKIFVYFYIIWRVFLQRYKFFGPEFFLGMKKATTYFSFLMKFVPGFILSRLLCKNLSDTTNPNWKVANIIERSWKTFLATTTSKSLLWIPMFIKHAYGPKPMPQFLTEYYLLWRYADCIDCYMVLQYCMYGFRKHLQEYDTEYVSQFFGFSTVGIQSRVQSTVASRMSSAGSSGASTASKASGASRASSAGSSASSASVAETGGQKETA